ncbi:MAG: hypothetical protein RIF41_07595 [Polyangiaceae bacterium]
MSGWTSRRDYTAGRAKVDEEGFTLIEGATVRRSRMLVHGEVCERDEFVGPWSRIDTEEETT